MWYNVGLKTWCDEFFSKNNKHKKRVQYVLAFYVYYSFLLFFPKAFNASIRSDISW